MLTRSRAGSVAIGILAVTAVVLSLMTATSTIAPAVAFAESGHWVVNAAERAVVHVDGGTAQVDARVELPADAGEPLFALQGEQQGFVVSRDRVAVFGRSTLTVDTTIPVEFDEVPVGIETVGGPYLVYPSAGTVVRLGVPPLSLPAGGPVERPVWTDDGTVWLHRPDNGSFCALRPGADALDCSAGAAPGEPGGLSITGDLPAFVGTRQDAAQIIKAAIGAPVGLGADVAETGLLADRDTEGRLAVVEPGVNRLVLTDSGGVPTGRAGGAAIPVDLGAGEFTSPIASRGVIAVLDVAANRLLTYDTVGRLLSATDLPPGSPPRLTRGGDGTIYVDDASGASTHVVGVDGSVTSVATGGLPPASVAIAAPPQRRSPLAPPPTFRQRLDLPGGGQVPPRPGSPVAPGSGGLPLGPGQLPVDGGAQPQPIVDPVRLATPTGVTARIQGDTVVVTWEPVVIGSQTVDYTVRYEGGVSQIVGKTDAVYIGLAPGAYRFTVQASVGERRSAISPNSNEVRLAGPAGGTVVSAALQGQNDRVAQYGVTWTEPELNGGEFLEYDVVVTDRSGEVLLAQPVQRNQFGTVGIDRCLAPYTFAVHAVTRLHAGQVVNGETTRHEFGDRVRCEVRGSITAGALDATTATVTIRFTGDTYAGGPCRLLFNGVVEWEAGCTAGNGQVNPLTVNVADLSPDTVYAVQFEVDPVGSSRTTSNVVTFRTPIT